MGTRIMDGTTQRFPQGGLEGKETFCFRSQEKNVLDIPSPKTTSCLNWGDLKTELGCFSGEQLDLLCPESVFVVLSPFVNRGLTVLQHAVDQPGKPVRHSSDGFRSP